MCRVFSSLLGGGCWLFIIEDWNAKVESQVSSIKYGDQILMLLEAVHLSAEVSVSHYKGHQKGSTEVAQGNQAADQAAERAALQNNDLIGVATIVPQINLPEIPYTEGETLKAKSKGFQEDNMGVVPKGDTWAILNEMCFFWLKPSSQVEESLTILKKSIQILQDLKEQAGESSGCL